MSGVTFLKDEKKHLADIEASIEKILTEKKQQKNEIDNGEAAAKAVKNSNDQANKADQQAAAAKQVQQGQKTASQQSVWDERLFDSIVRAGYAEEVYKDRAGKPIVNPNVGQPGSGGAPMTLEALEKDHKLLTIFFTRYSRALTETIQNCGSVFEALLTAGKSALADYYKVTK